MPSRSTSFFASLLLLPFFLDVVTAQTYRRLGACPTLGCVFPPDQTEFLPGQLFEHSVLETHAPTNGQRGHKRYYEDPLCTGCWREDARKRCCQGLPSSFRSPSLGDYRAILTYNGGAQDCRQLGGMTQPMITAARLIGPQVDQRQVSDPHADGPDGSKRIRSGMTDFVFSCLSVSDQLDDPKFETVGELFRRKIGGALGIVSTAYIADATPAGICAHTRSLLSVQVTATQVVVQEYLRNSSDVTPAIDWPNQLQAARRYLWVGLPLVPLAETVSDTPTLVEERNSHPRLRLSQRNRFLQGLPRLGYQVVHSNTQLKSLDTKRKTLGIFSVGNLAKWVDRNVRPSLDVNEILPQNLKGLKNSPTGDGSDAVDQPGLKDMTLKAIDVLQARTKRNEGWFLICEHRQDDACLDYDRALGELLELDDTIRASMAHLKKIGQLEDTLIVVTADHGHGFDVFGSADTEYLKAQTDDERSAVLLSQYQVAPGSTADNQTILFGAEGTHFPVQWTPRYAFAAGAGGVPDHRESYTLNTNGPRSPASKGEDGTYNPNPADRVDGFTIRGTLPVDYDQGVHSLQDVPVYASGPGAASFRGVYNSIDVFFKIAEALGLGGK
ncbi:alkaline phosphatase [Coprinopsis sp. MPI-PUGE-AT-0042]|nr:alkaline phosphatase [Coprinopsis sp. MPI-PUGE-AT-0042]